MTDHGPEHIGPRPLAGYVMRDYGEAITTLRNSRVSRGLTQLRVARRAGTGRAQLSNYETGKTMPAAPTLFDLAHALGYDLALIPREEPMHLCPDDNSGITSCCGRTPYELPRTDRITEDPAEVTCKALIYREDDA